eukprot:COSAG01_NODE_8154_length_2899_cov_1.594286_2_plen_74_part_00
MALGPWDGILDLGYPGWLHQRLLLATTIRYSYGTRYSCTTQQRSQYEVSAAAVQISCQTEYSLDLLIPNSVRS